MTILYAFFRNQFNPYIITKTHAFDSSGVWGATVPICGAHIISGTSRINIEIKDTHLDDLCGNCSQSLTKMRENGMIPEPTITTIKRINVKNKAFRIHVKKVNGDFGGATIIKSRSKVSPKTFLRINSRDEWKELNEVIKSINSYI